MKYLIPFFFALGGAILYELIVGQSTNVFMQILGLVIAGTAIIVWIWVFDKLDF
jgi:hypothetical protein